jgi:hypothetical protein
MSPPIRKIEVAGIRGLDPVRPRYTSSALLHNEFAASALSVNEVSGVRKANSDTTTDDQVADPVVAEVRCKYSGKIIAARRRAKD